jgi:agmatine deiminase
LTRLYPEWAVPRSLFLVWPEGLPGRGYLAGFYLDLLAGVPKGLRHVTMIIRDRRYRDRVYRRIKTANQDLAIEFLEIPGVRDIWIRDWAPLMAQDGKGRTIAVKAVYRPKYLVPHAIEDAEAGNAAGEAIAAYLGLPVLRLPLVWDIGNFTHNGQGIGIVTNRIIADNENMSIEEICSLFRTKLGISRLLFIPVEPGDETGHVDGMVRFLSLLTIVVGAYGEQYRAGHGFLNALCDKLHRQLGRRFLFIRLKNRVPEDRKREGIMSALGNSVNFLRLGKAVLVPDYGRGLLPEARLLSRPFLPVSVRSAHLPELARLGGALNCISWVSY